MSSNEPQIDPRTAPHPERHMAVRCGRMVDKGLVSYPCTRPQGHTEIPPGDPEPCYAMEVPVSLRRWQRWAARQQQAQEQAQERPGHGEADTVADGLSSQFGAVHARPPGNGEHTAVIHEVHCADFLLHEPHLWESVSMAGVVLRCDGTGVRSESVALPGSLDDVEHAMNEAADEVFLARAAETEQAAPTRTRPGDQPLPSGDPDMIDDQTLVMADIEARRRVGIERYGQTHRPFNGRNTLQDEYEEMIDRLVYQRSLLRLREATRVDIMTVVAKVLAEDGALDEAEVVNRISAKVAQRLADWATMHRAEQEGSKYAYSGERRERAMAVDPDEVDPALTKALTDLSETYGLLGVLSHADRMFQGSDRRG